MGSQTAFQNGRSDCPKCGANLGAVMRISDNAVTEVFCPNASCSYSKDVDAPPEEFPSTPDLE
jgi:hypothetical protein